MVTSSVARAAEHEIHTGPELMCGYKLDKAYA